MVLSASLGLTPAQALAAVLQVGPDSVLALPGGAGTITFAGLAAAALTVDDFVIA
jgi:hypothetical protein